MEDVKEVLSKIGKICNAWANDVLDSEEAMEEVYKIVIEHGFDEFARKNPRRAREIEREREQGGDLDVR